MDTATIAYLAGAMDADGCFSIKRSTQRKRMKGDCQSPIYIPRILFGQVQPQVCELLKTTFTGTIYIQKPGTTNSKPQYKFICSNSSAANACKTLLPHLRLKGDRAQLLIGLHEWRTNLEVRKPTYWWLRENPNWQSGRMLTAAGTMAMLGYKHPTCINQALTNGLLVALPIRGNRYTGQALRFPEGLVEFLRSLIGKTDMKNFRYKLPPQFIAKCHEYYEKARALNSIGIHGTTINHRTGCFAPAE